MRLLLVAPALAAVLAIDQGGFDPSAWVWSGAIAAWAAAMVALVLRTVVVPRRAWAWLAGVTAVLAWTTASIWWSDRRTQTLLEARRTTVYAALVLALIVTAQRGGARRLVLATHVALTGLVLYALARYLFGSRPVDTFEGTLLAQPLGYANAVGVLAAIGITLALGLSATHRRSAIAASVPLFAATIAFTQSRGALLALAVGLAAMLALAEGWSRLLRVAVAASPGAAVAAIAAIASKLSDDNARPVHHAVLIVCAATVAGSALTTLLMHRAGAGSDRRFPLPGRSAAALVALAGVAALAVAGVTQPRTSLWHVAWHEFTTHPVIGSGAGTFALAWAHSGLVESRGGALDAHSLYLETPAELGVVGLALFVAFLVVPLVRLQERSLEVAAALGGYVVFLVHAGVDWDWEMPAVVVTGLCCGAAVLSGTRDEQRAEEAMRRPQRFAVAALAVMLGIVSIAGARSSAEPGVVRAPLVVGVAVPVTLAVPAPVLVLRRDERGARGHLVAVAQVRLHRLRRDGDHRPGVLPRPGPMAHRHAVLPTRRAVLVAG